MDYIDKLLESLSPVDIAVCTALSDTAIMLNRRRHELGLSIERAAALCEVKPSKIREYESGEYDFKLSELYSYIKKLNDGGIHTRQTFPLN